MGQNPAEKRVNFQRETTLKASGYAPALVNLGNLCLLRGLPGEALGFYQKAAAMAPHDPVVLLGLARSNHELQHWELVQEECGELQRQDPQLAEQFSYLRLQGEQAAKAAEAVKDLMVWGEEK